MFNFKNETVNNVLRLAVIVSVVAAAWATALGQFTSFVAAGETRNETIAFAELRKVFEAEAKLQNAVAACVPYKFPHAVIVGSKVYCYTIYYGTEYIFPLEYLKKQGPPPTPDPG